jgi:hypothetical protein
MSKFKEDLIEISKATGISINTLESLPEEKVLEALMSFNTGNLSEIYHIADMQMYYNMLKKVSQLTGVPHDMLIRLPQDKIEHLVGQYTMEIDITPDEELRNSLLEVINSKEE